MWMCASVSPSAGCAALTVNIDHTLDCDHYHDHNHSVDHSVYHSVDHSVDHNVDYSVDHVDYVVVTPCNGEGLQCWQQGQGEESCDCK